VWVVKERNNSGYKKIGRGKKSSGSLRGAVLFNVKLRGGK